MTLLCLCIVFVPMFQLGGVAGYLFRPLAEAVVFALIGSFILSRTLVPTMANYLMRAHHHSVESHIGHEPVADTFAQSAVAVPAGLRDSSSSGSATGTARCWSMALRQRRRPSCRRFSPASCCRSGWCRFWVRISFPSVDSGQILMHVRAQPGTRIEETARLLEQIEQTVRATIPPDQLDNIVDNIGLPFSGINMAYQNTGTIGPEDGDALISLKEDHGPTAGLRQGAAHHLAAEIPGQRSFPSCLPTSCRRS